MWRQLTHLVMTRGLSSVGRALPLQGRGQGFESPRLHNINAGQRPGAGRLADHPQPGGHILGTLCGTRERIPAVGHALQLVAVQVSVPVQGQRR
jgi:hypothetical protein